MDIASLELAIGRGNRATLTAREAAEYLGISYWLLLEMCKRKEIPHIRAGARVLLRTESLDRWLTSQEAASVQVDKPATGKGALRRIEA